MKLDPKALEAAKSAYAETLDNDTLGDAAYIVRAYRSNLQPSKEVRELVEPVAWLHEIIEPDNQPQTLLSRSPNNPWSHWLEAHRDKCTYRVTPLYAADLLSRMDGEGWRPKVKALVWEKVSGSTYVADSVLGRWSRWEMHYAPPDRQAGTPTQDPIAAAQADYERRILSALDLPAPSVEEKPTA